MPTSQMRLKQTERSRVSDCVCKYDIHIWRSPIQRAREAAEAARDGRAHVDEPELFLEVLATALEECGFVDVWDSTYSAPEALAGQRRWLYREDMAEAKRQIRAQAFGTEGPAMPLFGDLA